MLRLLLFFDFYLFTVSLQGGGTFLQPLRHHRQVFVIPRAIPRRPNS